MAKPEAPAYVAELLARRDEVQRSHDGRGKFLHLGHFASSTIRPPTHEQLLDAQVQLNRELLALAKLTDENQQVRVLDVGCGIGGTLAEIAKLHPRAALTGLNIDPQQLGVAKATVPPPREGSLQWIEGDACALPFENASFDVVLAVESIFHYASRAVFLCEASRVLRAEGRLVLSDLLLTECDAASEAILQRGLGPWPAPVFASSEYETLAEKAGLRVETLFDASAATLPSWDCFEHTGAPSASPTRRAMDESVALLARAHRNGLLQVVYVSMSK